MNIRDKIPKGPIRSKLRMPREVLRPESDIKRVEIEIQFKTREEWEVTEEEHKRLVSDIQREFIYLVEPRWVGRDMGVDDGKNVTVVIDERDASQITKEHIEDLKEYFENRLNVNIYDWEINIKTYYEPER